jgi:Right handed beta helix region
MTSIKSMGRCLVLIVFVLPIMFMSSQVSAETVSKKTTIRLFLPILLFSDHESASKKITICHFPPDDPLNPHTIEVSKASVSAHLANHGDYLGPCIDSDGDGVEDSIDECDDDASKTEVGICGCGVADTDSDGDGTADCNDSCPDDTANDADNDGVCGNIDQCPGYDDNADADGDGIADGCDACPDDTANDADNDGVCGNIDQCPGYDDSADADGDGIADGCDACPDDAANDADSDGVCGDVDQCPGFDDNADADGDGIADGCDACPDDAANDTDNDGVCGDVDQCPGFDDNADADGDGIADGCDTCSDDTDNDGVCDDVDQCPGFDDNADADGDGIADGCDACPNDAPNDPDNDGICGVSPLCLAYDDSTNDDEDLIDYGCDINPYDVDSDGFCVSSDNCTQDANPDQTDSDGDGIGDVCDTCPNDKDNDADNDGVCGDVDQSPGFNDNGGTAANLPQIDWLGGTCVTNGAKPALGAAGGDFEFAMKYTDPDACPSPGVFQVWIDLDGGGYSGSEQFDMVESNPADINCSDGKVYRYTTTISNAGTYNYRFHANDGFEDAVGEATTTRRVEVVDAVAVHNGQSIQSVIRWDQTILVYEGTYPENIRLTTGQGNNSNVTIQSVCGPEVTTIQGTFIDDHRTGTIGVQGVSNPVIDGFTISGGYNGIVLNGGLTVKNCIIEKNQRGIYAITTHSRLIVEDTIIRDNEFAGPGAGIFFNSGGPHLISRSVITNNKSTNGFGGGVFLQNSTCGLTIEDTTISNNSSHQETWNGWGGGFYCTRSYNGNPEPAVSINNSTISSNSATGHGGGLYLKDGCEVTITNSNVVDNTAGSNGGGLFLGNYNRLPINLNMTNCTVSNNKQTNTGRGTGGGGIFNRLSNVSIHNSIFWENEAAGDLGAHEAYAWLGLGNSFVFTYSDVMNNQNNFRTKDGSIGSFEFHPTCIDADPLFVDSDNGDYHLKPDSPAIDQGTSDDAPADDIDGEARPYPAGGSHDMGADEYVDN